jgi:hypothetical protein
LGLFLLGFIVSDYIGGFNGLREIDGLGSLLSSSSSSTPDDLFRCMPSKWTENAAFCEQQHRDFYFHPEKAEVHRQAVRQAVKDLREGRNEIVDGKLVVKKNTRKSE